jgi:hypothetical protein
VLLVVSAVLQRGCWHRPLHPEIFTWPEDTAYRPVSHLPLLGWTAGRARDIADTLLAQFQGVRSTVKERREGGQLRVCVNSAVQVTDDGRVVPHDEAKAFDVVILAVGFGIEALPFDLPWNSYWRVDPLDQTLLDEDIAQPAL